MFAGLHAAARTDVLYAVFKDQFVFSLVSRSTWHSSDQVSQLQNIQDNYMNDYIKKDILLWIRERGFQTLPSVRIPTQPYADHSVLIGVFLRQLKLIFSNSVSDTFHFPLLPDNWDNFHWILSNTIKRFPIQAESECETLITGADSFTSNGRLIMNESAEIDNYFVASGFNGHGIALAGVVYGEVLGYECPLFFKPDEVRKKDLCKQGTFGKACHMYAMRLTHTSEDGFMFFIPSEKNFVGKEALLKQRQDVIEILSGEPIYRNGEFCGLVTSAVHGFTLGKQICLGLVPAPSSEKITVSYILGATYEIDIATKRFKARPNVYQPTEMISTNSQYVSIL
ncbi:unnamed protein product [Adineta steineri]|uniref:Aminomethyltransferase C-terminal domain-containing protein n=1 Tax=Adineta steineri TaxID=433720 RepID=A0A819NVR9_9BILA|nr:unnamed protein product [Adineta steineri]